MLKRSGTCLLVMVLILSLLTFPAVADGDLYTVTFLDGSTDTVAGDQDFTFSLESLDSYEGKVAYADFGQDQNAKDHICAFELIKNEDSYSFFLAAKYIDGDFTIRIFDFTSPSLAAEFEVGEDSAYLIGTELDLLKLMVISNHNADNIPEGTCFRLTDDIVFHTPLNLAVGLANGYTYLAPSAQMVQTTLGFNTQFKGVLDGEKENGGRYTVSGLHWGERVCNTKTGLVENNQGTVKNLVLSYSDSNTLSPSYNTGYGIYELGYVSCLVNNNNGGIIENCDVAIEKICITNRGVNNWDSYEPRTGLIAATNQTNGIIRSCSVDADLTQTCAAVLDIGLICGENSGAIDRCESNGSLTVIIPSFDSTDWTYQVNESIGGVVGYSYEDTASVSKCLNRSKIVMSSEIENEDVQVSVGGIAGGAINVTYCGNYGSITCEDASYYALLGGVSGQGDMYGSWNLGKVVCTGDEYMAFGGGLSGQSAYNTLTASFSYVPDMLDLPFTNIPDWGPENYFTSVYSLAAETYADDHELSAEDFADPALVTALNAALGEDIFVAGEDYPIFSWLAETPTPTVVYGDVDGNGIVESIDAALTYAYYNEKTTLTAEQLAAADVDGNGTVDSIDAALIYAYYNEKLAAFPAAGN